MTNTPEPDDTGIGELLRKVGARDEPSAQVTQEVYTAVYAEWRDMVSERTRSRRRRIFAIAASIAVVAVSATLGIVMLSPQSVPVASITRVDGTLLVASADAALAPRATGEQIRKGEIVHTDASSRAAIVLADGLSARLDRDTTVRVTAQDTLVLDTGALYVDARPNETDTHPLTIETHVGSVRHVGTQYEVRAHSGDIAVSVREGRVMIDGVGGQVAGVAGERVEVTTNGVTTRTRLSPRDAYWQWVTQAAPPFDIADRPLSEFLTWIARETGRKLTYASPQVQSVAEQVKLSGSITGLDLDTALVTVLSTTQLRHKADAETLGIDVAAPVDR